MKKKQTIKNISIIFILAFSMVIPTYIFADNVNISQEINFGVDIFTKGDINSESQDLDSLFNNLDKYKSYPMHAALIRKYINKAAEGTKDISDVKIDLLKLYEKIIIRYNPKNEITIFDRSFVAMFIASYNYPEFPSKI